MTAWVVESAGLFSEASKARWDQLNDQRFGAHPLLNAGFAASLLEVYGSGLERLCWLADGQGDLLAAVCLVPQGKHGWASFMAPPAQLSLALVSDPVQLESLFASLPGRATSIDLPCQDTTLVKLTSVNPQRTEISAHVLTTVVPLLGTFDSFWSSRPSNLRKNLHRYERKTAERGLLARLACWEQAVDVKAGLLRYGELEQRGWKGRLGTALDHRHRQYGFFEQILSQAATDARALVYELYLNEQLAASRLVLVGGSRVVILKTTYDETLAAFAPGRQLLKAVIEDLFARHAGKALEFYTNADINMLQWSARSRPIVHVRKYRSFKDKESVDRLRQLRSFVRSFLAVAGPQPMKQVEDDSEFSSVDALTVQCYAHPNEFPRPVAALMERAEAQCIEWGSHWFALQTDHALDPADQPLFYVLRRGDQVLAVLPMMLTPGHERLTQGMRLESLSNFYTSLFSPLLGEGSQLTQKEFAFMLGEVRLRHRKTTRWQIGPLDPQSPSYSFVVRALQDAGLVTFSYFRFGNWFEPAQPWATYLAQRDGRMRNMLERKKRKLLALGAQVEIIQSAEAGLEAGIAGYLQVYAKCWKQAEPYPSFVPALIRKAADRGWLRLGLVWLNGQAVAAQIWFVAGRKASIFKLAYDEGFKDLSAGTVLTAALMEHVLDADRVTEVDYLIGDDAYKRDWMSQRRERWGLLAFDPCTWRGLLGLLREATGRITKRICNVFRNGSSPIAEPVAVYRYAHIDQVPPDALLLLELHSKQGSYHGAAWFRNLQDTVFEGHKVVSYYVLQRHGQSVAVLPIRCETTTTGLNIVALANYYTPLFEPALAPSLDPAQQADALCELLQAIRVDHPKMASLIFSPMDRSSSSYLALLQALRLAKFKPFEYFCFVNRFLAPIQSWVDYLASRKASLRSTLKRLGKRFETDGGSFSLFTAPSHVAEGLVAYEQVYASSWKRPEPFPKFIPGLLATYAKRGELRLGVAMLGGQAVAAQIWLVVQGRAEIHKVAYDEAFKQYSPGSLLTGYLLKHVSEIDKVAEVDYLIGNDDYKAIWMNSQRERWGIVAYNPRALFGLLKWWREMLGRGIKASRQRWPFTRFSRRLKGVPLDRAPHTGAQSATTPAERDPD